MTIQSEDNLMDELAGRSTTKVFGNGWPAYVEGTTPSPVIPNIDIDLGSRIGDYIVLEKIGSGGMGLVVAAFDPKLDRKVAIKLLRDTQRDNSSRRQRMEREAQTMAQLSHPNVVTIYEVNEHEGQLYLAMEFVKGIDLRRWLDRDGANAGWSDVVELFLQAGEGLRSAHEFGIVHRDFKPGNVFLGDDGRVRVGDFGLARQGTENDPELASTREDLAIESTVAHSLTATDAIVGTPLYMAPEQFEGVGCDAQSDQFAFCVALWEALYGQRPYAGETVQELAANVLAGRRTIPPSTRSVPSWLNGVVVRGLETNPEDRWPTIRELLDALANDPRPRRRRRIAAYVAITAVAGGAWQVREALRTDAQYCKHAETRLEGVWDDARREAVRRGILETGLNIAPDTWERVERYLDDYTGRWISARVDTCNATHFGEQSEGMMELRMSCLDKRLEYLRATVREFAHADTDVVVQSMNLLKNLPQLSHCANIDALKAKIPPPEDPMVAVRVKWLTEELNRAQIKYDSGKYPDARIAAESVLKEALNLAYEPLTVSARRQLGKFQSYDPKFAADAEENFWAAYHGALRLKMLNEAMLAAEGVVSIFGIRRRDQTSAERHIETTIALTEAAGTELDKAQLFNSIGEFAYSQQDHESAREYFQKAIEIYESKYGADHLQIARTLSRLASVDTANGEYAVARAAYERVLNIVEQSLGETHPERARHLKGMARVDIEQERYDSARKTLMQARSLEEAVYGPNSIFIAETLNMQGELEDHVGDYERARILYERSLEISQQAPAPNPETNADVSNVLDPELSADILMHLGTTAKKQGHFSEAREYYRRSLEVFGPEHPLSARTLLNLGTLEYVEGRYREARENWQLALDSFERTLRPDHPHIATALGNLANIAYFNRDYSVARENVLRAIDVIAKSKGPNSVEVARLHDRLGIYAQAEGKFVEAREHHDRALAIFTELDGAEHRDAAHTLGNLGKIARIEGNLVKAIEFYKRALVVLEKTVGPDHIDVARPLVELGLLHHNIGSLRDALKYLERALVLCEERDREPVIIGNLRFALAQVLWDSPRGHGRDRRRARDLAKQAEASYTARGEPSRLARNQVATWLKHHRL